MKRFRGISLSTHSVGELVSGLALLVAAFALDPGTAGMLALFGAGVLLAGMGLGSAENLPLSAHAALDGWLTTALAAASAALALTGEPAAGLALLGAATVQMLLLTLTHWSRPATAR